MTAGIADQHAEPSTDLELAVAWEFVDRMAGRLWVESEPDRGTRFVFRLPARR
jgi:signal transduction histidine kinase